MKKLFLIIISFAIVFANTSTAKADGGIDNWNEVSTHAELKSAFESGQNIKLKNDIVMDTVLANSTGVVDITIDLAGHKLNYTGSGYMLKISEGRLKVLDSVGAGEINYTVNASTTSGIINVISYGVFELESGALSLRKTGATTGIAYGVYGRAIIDGGSISVINPAATYGIYNASVTGKTSINNANIYVESTNGAATGVYQLPLAAAGARMPFEINSGTISVKSAAGEAVGVRGEYRANLVDTCINGGKILVETSSTSHDVKGVTGFAIFKGGEVAVNNPSSTKLAYIFATDVASKNGSIIHGGKFVVQSENPSNDVTAYKGITIAGGSHNINPIGTTSTLAQGKEVVSTGIETTSPFMVTKTLSYVVNDDISKPFVAKNITTNLSYRSIFDAVNSAGSNETVRLLDDIDLTNEGIVLSKPITIDLNGFDITASNKLSYIFSASHEVGEVVITDSSLLKSNVGTISGGLLLVTSCDVKIEKINMDLNTGTLAFAVELLNGVKDDYFDFVLSGVNIDFTTTQGSFSYFIKQNKFNNVTVSDGPDDGFGLNVNITSSGSTVALSDTVNGTTSLSVLSGNYNISTTHATGKAYIIKGSTSLTHELIVEDGRFKFSGLGAVETYVGAKSGTSNISITGGLYNFATILVPDGYAAVANTDLATNTEYPYKVVEFGAAETIAPTTAEYSSLQLAINAVVANSSLGTISLLRSITISKSLTINGNVEIDKAGYSLNFTSSPAVILASGVTMPTAINNEFQASITRSDGKVEYYNTLSQAISRANGDTVKLLRDINTATRISISNSVTIDANGFDVISAEEYSFQIISLLFGGNDALDVSIINNSSTESTITGGIYLQSRSQKAIFTVGQNVEIISTCAVFILGDGNKDSKSATLNVYGTLTSTEVNGEQYAAIQGNGQAQYAGTVINIYDGAVVQGGNSSAIYHPQNGDLNIHGGELSGYSVIYMKSGNLVVDGPAVFTANGAKVSYQENANLLTGDTLIIESCDYPGGLPSVSISDGVFNSEHGTTLQFYAKANATESISDKRVVTGGTFNDLSKDYINLDYIDEDDIDTDNIIVKKKLVSITMDEQYYSLGDTIYTTLDPVGATVSYEWYRVDNDGNETIISSCTTYFYTTSQDDQGYKIKVVAKGTGSYSGEVEVVSNLIDILPNTGEADMFILPLLQLSGLLLLLLYVDKKRRQLSH